MSCPVVSLLFERGFEISTFPRLLVTFCLVAKSTYFRESYACCLRQSFFQRYSILLLAFRLTVFLYCCADFFQVSSKLSRNSLLTRMILRFDFTLDYPSLLPWTEPQTIFYNKFSIVSLLTNWSSERYGSYAHIGPILLNWNLNIWFFILFAWLYKLFGNGNIYF